MKLFNIILIIFAVCVCTGILIIISRLDLIKEQIVAIAAILTTLVSKPNNRVKYGGLNPKLNCSIIIDGLNIINKFTNLLTDKTIRIVVDNHHIEPICSLLDITEDTKFAGDIDVLFKHVINSLLNATTKNVHFVTKEEKDYYLYNCMLTFAIKVNQAKQDPIYNNIKQNINRLKFYIAECKPDQERYNTIMRRNNWNPPDKYTDDDYELHALKEQDDNCIMKLSYELNASGEKVKILSYDFFNGMRNRKIPSNYQLTTINFNQNSQGKIETKTTISNIETKKEEKNVIREALNIQANGLLPVYLTKKKGEEITEIEIDTLLKYGNSIDYEHTTTVLENDAIFTGNVKDEKEDQEKTEAQKWYTDRYQKQMDEQQQMYEQQMDEQQQQMYQQHPQQMYQQHPQQMYQQHPQQMYEQQMDEQQMDEQQMYEQQMDGYSQMYEQQPQMYEQQPQMYGDQHSQPTTLKANAKAFIPLAAQSSTFNANAKPFIPSSLSQITTKISAMDINASSQR